MQAPTYFAVFQLHFSHCIDTTHSGSILELQRFSANFYMTDDRKKPRPLTERIKERLGELAEELFDSVAGAFAPPPRPVPIPVRNHPRRYR